MRAFLLVLLAACSSPLLVLLAACSSPPPAPTPPPPPPAPEVPPEPQPLPVSATAVDGAGSATPLVAGSRTEIAPGCTLELRSELALTHLRVRLLGEDDRLVPSRHAFEVGRGTTVRVAPEEPLPPGTDFRLEIGPDDGPAVTSVDGLVFQPAHFELHTTGEKPPPPRRRHRRR